MWHGVLVRRVKVEVTAEDRQLALRGSRGLLEEHLARLAAEPVHGNTKLTGDQLVLGLLLAFFDPLVRSLRLIEGCGDFSGRLNLQRLARSTTADALTLFDPARLRPLIADLRRRVPTLAHDDADLGNIARKIIAADGTYLNTIVDVAWALRQHKSNGRPQRRVRINVQLDVLHWTPEVVSVSGDDGESEPAAFARDLLAGVLYVVDRNFVDFDFLHQVFQHHSDFVLRIKRNMPAMRTLRSRELSAADVQAGVVADEIVQLTGPGAPQRELRCVTLTTLNRSGERETIRLLTSLNDADAVAPRVIGAIYRQRWQIELFFKWLKTWARMDHLLCTSRQGIQTQLYIAVIAVLMMSVQSGKRVSIYTLAALSRVARGEMSLADAMNVIARRERERSQDRARQARRRTRKKLA